MSLMFDVTNDTSIHGLKKGRFVMASIFAGKNDIFMLVICSGNCHSWLLFLKVVYKFFLLNHIA